EVLIKYEALLEAIHTKQPEYEYGYLFCEGADYPLLHPAPYQTAGEREANEQATEALIQSELEEFEKQGYQIEILARVCEKESYSSLGRCLAKYWKGGAWDFETFEILLSSQK